MPEKHCRDGVRTWVLVAESFSSSKIAVRKRIGQFSQFSQQSFEPRAHSW